MIKELDNKNLVDSLKGVFELKEDVEKMIMNTQKNLVKISKRLPLV